jgi:hypothetical protein
VHCMHCPTFNVCGAVCLHVFHCMCSTVCVAAAKRLFILQSRTLPCVSDNDCLLAEWHTVLLTAAEPGNTLYVSTSVKSSLSMGYTKARILGSACTHTAAAAAEGCKECSGT